MSTNYYYHAIALLISWHQRWWGGGGFKKHGELFFLKTNVAKSTRQFTEQSI